MDLPVLRAVGLHEVFVWIEENSPVIVDTSHPDRQDWSLVPRAEVHLRHLLWVRVPVQESKLISSNNSNFSVWKLRIV